jgi:hypothetical protein
MPGSIGRSDTQSHPPMDAEKLQSDRSANGRETARQKIAPDLQLCLEDVSLQAENTADS